MNTNSNSYTIIYASVMVVIVAFLLAFVSSSLPLHRTRTWSWIRRNKFLPPSTSRMWRMPMQNINKYIKGDMLMNEDGTLTENTGAFAPPTKRKARKPPSARVCMQKWTEKRNMYSPFTVPVFGRHLGVCGPERATRIPFTAFTSLMPAKLRVWVLKSQPTSSRRILSAQEDTGKW